MCRTCFLPDSALGSCGLSEEYARRAGVQNRLQNQVRTDFLDRLYVGYRHFWKHILAKTPLGPRTRLLRPRRHTLRTFFPTRPFLFAHIFAVNFAIDFEPDVAHIFARDLHLIAENFAHRSVALHTAPVRNKRLKGLELRNHTIHTSMHRN